jgi:hypothetical protein
MSPWEFGAGLKNLGLRYNINPWLASSKLIILEHWLRHLLVAIPTKPFFSMTRICAPLSIATGRG